MYDVSLHIYHGFIGVVEYTATESEAPPRSRENPLLIVNWHIKPDMRIYQGPDLHSSPIQAVEGNVVKTVSGHYYILVGRDPNIRVVQQLLAPAGSPHDTYCTENPLNPVSLSQLLLAEKIVYGDAKIPCAQLISALQRVENALGPHEQLETIKEILVSFGIAPTSVSTEQVACSPPIQLPSSQIKIRYGLLLGHQDTSLGHHIAVLSRVTLRELVLRIIYEHRQKPYFSLCLMKPEPISSSDIVVEWSGASGDGCWIPDESCESVVVGNTPLSGLGFGPETEMLVKVDK